MSNLFNTTKRAGTTMRRPSQAVANRQPGKAPIRRNGEGWTTASVFTLWRAVLIAVCLVCGVVATPLLAGNSDAIRGAQRSTQVLTELQNFKGDVLSVDSAVNARAVASAATVDDPAEALADANRRLAEVSGVVGTTTNRSDTMQEIASQYATYSWHLTAAANATDATAKTAALNQADTVLTQQLLPSVESEMTYYEGQVKGAQVESRWLGLLLAVPAILILVACVVHAQRTRRIINFGLLIALVAAGGAWYLADQTLAQAVSVTDGNRVGPQQTAVASASAYADSASALAADTRAARIQDPLARSGQAQEAVQASSDNVAKLNNTTATADLEAFTASREALRSALSSPTLPVETLNSELSAHQKLAQTLDTSSAGALSELTRSSALAADSANNHAVFVAMLSLVAAISAGVGLSQALRRYR